MSGLLTVEGLHKTYPAFELGPVSFAVEAGSIMGFIGRNGAGKTTTLKSILNIVHPDGGEIRYFGRSLAGNEREIKQRVGFSGGAVNWYPRKRISDILAVTKRFTTPGTRPRTGSIWIFFPSTRRRFPASCPRACG